MRDDGPAIIEHLVALRRIIGKLAPRLAKQNFRSMLGIVQKVPRGCYALKNLDLSRAATNQQLNREHQADPSLRSPKRSEPLSILDWGAQRR